MDGSPRANGVEDSRPVVFGITGASGSIVASRTIEALLAERVPVVASATSAARLVWKQEMEESFGAAIEAVGRTPVRSATVGRWNWRLRWRAERTPHAEW